MSRNRRLRIPNPILILLTLFRALLLARVLPLQRRQHLLRVSLIILKLFDLILQLRNPLRFLRIGRRFSSRPRRRI